MLDVDDAYSRFSFCDGNSLVHNKLVECASCFVVIAIFPALPDGVGSVRFCNPRLYTISCRCFLN